MKKKKCRVVACQKKKEESQNECLQEDIIFEILTRLPAEFLHNYGRNVCQEWADLINNPTFIESHHSRSHTELLIQHTGDHELKFLEVNKENAILKQETLDFSGNVMSSCNGITLFCLSEENFSLCIANIVTKQIIELPFAPLDPGDPILAAIGYDYLHGKFKVICFYNGEDESCYWLFFIVGKDEAWRKVDIVSPRVLYESFYNRRWISAGGVIYGIYMGSKVSGNIIAVDVGDETTWVVDIPNYKEEKSGGFVVEKNKLMNITHGQKETMVSVYRLDEFRQSAWVKIYKFRLHPNYYRLIEKSNSLAWVDNGDMFFLHYSSPAIWVYNFRTGSYKVLKHLSWCIQIFAMSKNLIRF